jgi:hypothetical protein
LAITEQTKTSFDQLIKWAEAGYRLSRLGLVTRTELIPEVLAPEDIIEINTHLVITSIRLTGPSYFAQGTIDKGLLCFGQFMSQEESEIYIDHQMPDQNHQLINLTTGQCIINGDSVGTEEPIYKIFSCWLDRTWGANLQKFNQLNIAEKRFNYDRQKNRGGSCGLRAYFLTQSQSDNGEEILDFSLFTENGRLLP